MEVFMLITPSVLLGTFWRLSSRPKNFSKTFCLASLGVAMVDQSYVALKSKIYQEGEKIMSHKVAGTSITRCADKIYIESSQPDFIIATRLNRRAGDL